MVRMYLLPLVSIERRSVGSSRNEFWYQTICNGSLSYGFIVIRRMFEVPVEDRGRQRLTVPASDTESYDCLFKLGELKLLLLFPLLLDFHINYQTFTHPTHPTSLRTVAKGAHETQKHFCRHVSCRKFVQRLLLFALWTFCCFFPSHSRVITIVKCFCRRNSRKIWMSDIDSSDVCRCF